MMLIWMFLPNKKVFIMYTLKDLNLLQMCWFELQKYYDMSIMYHPSKVKVVSDSFSRLSKGSVSHVEGYKKDLVYDVDRLTQFVVRLVVCKEAGITIHKVWNCLL